MLISTLPPQITLHGSRMREEKEKNTDRDSRDILRKTN